MPQNPFQNARQNRPFYYGNKRYDDQRGQGHPPQRQWNSSNAPRQMNDAPVPMDLDCCCECGQMGHFAQNCQKKKKQENINLLDYEEDDSITIPPIPLPRDKVASVKQQLSSLTDQERDTLAKEMGLDEDFPAA